MSIFKKVFAVVVAIAILATGILISVPTVVKSADPELPTIGTNDDLASTLHYANPSILSFTYNEDDPVINVLSNVGFCAFGQFPRLQDTEAIYYAADITVPATYAGEFTGLVYGTFDDGDGFNKRIGVGIRNTNQYYCAIDSYESDATNGPWVTPSGATLTAGETVRMVVKYDAGAKTVTTWWKKGNTVITSGAMDISGLSNFNFNLGVIGYTVGTTFTNIDIWKVPTSATNTTFVNYADYATVDKDGVAYEDKVLQTNEVKSVFTFDGLEIDLSDGKEVIMEATVDTTSGMLADKEFSYIGINPVKIAGAANRTGMYLNNNGGNTDWFTFIATDDNVGNPNKAIWPNGTGALQTTDTGRTYVVKIVVTATKLTFYVNGAYTTNNGGAFLDGTFTGIDPQIVIVRGTNGETTVSDVKIYGSAVSIGDKTYNDFTFKKTQRLNAETWSYFNGSISNEVMVNDSVQPLGSHTREVTNVSVGFDDTYTVSARYEALVGSINDSHCFLGLLLGKYTDSTGTDQYLYFTHFANWGENIPLNVWNDNQSGPQVVSGANMRAVAGNPLWYVTVCNYQYTYKDGVYTCYFSTQDNDLVEVGSISVEDICEHYGIESYDPVVGLQTVRRNETYNGKGIKATKFKVSTPGDATLKIVAPMSGNSGSVYVTGISDGIASVSVVPASGYQLAAGTLKNNDTYIINNIDDKGAEFAFKLVDGSNKLSATFTATSTTSVSTAVLGTQLHRTSGAVDGIRFLNRIYLASIAEDCNVQQDTLTVKYNGTEYTIKDYGVVAGAKADYTDVNDMKIDNATWTVSGKDGKIFALTENYIDVTVIITPTTVDATFLAKEYAVRGYVVLTDGTNDVTIYSNVFVDSCNAAANRGA